jgi:hypothetical protein
MMEQELQEDEIRQRAMACKGVFDACAASPALKEHGWIRSAQGDFNLWCSAIKATALGKPSMDYRLRNHPDVREAVCDLLTGLTTSVERYVDILNNPCKFESCSKKHRKAFAVMAANLQVRSALRER